MEDTSPIFPVNADGQKVATNEDIVKEIVADNEIDYYKQLKKKNKNYLVDGLDEPEQKRVAEYILAEIAKGDKKHQELCDRITEWDAISRMERKPVIGDDGDMPNYRTPFSSVAHEVIHANEMNVIFSPKDVMRVIPTEPNDIPKISKLTTFGNWSMKNELDLFINTDRLFHSSGKNGECPYIVHWVKEYGTEIKREILMNPADPKEPLYDPDTGEVLYQESEEQRLLYNGPKLEVFSRKDYLQPDDAVMNELPPWEARIIRLGYDDVWKDMLSGKMFEGCLKKIRSWGEAEQPENEKNDYQGDQIPMGEWEKECYEWYGRMRVTIVKEKMLNKIEAKDINELEDEFIAIVHKKSKTLLSLRKNKFPLKMRPIGIDYFEPDDEGRRAGIGIYERLDSLQKAYDALYNQFIFGVQLSNNPIGFFTPTGNMRNEPLKIRNGFLYPTADASSVNIIKTPMPDQSLTLALQLINQWGQLVYGISDYAAGIESRIDPGAPARKAAIVVEQGNVRMNLLIKRKNNTLKDIFKRWYLLYRDNMPPNKFMRIVGDDEQNPWKFESIKIEDFALKSLPDFELTGNVLSANKQLQINTKIAAYQLLISNPFFSPQTKDGLQALHSLTKWLIDGLDEVGLSRFMPKMPGENITTPEEENARFLQGDDGNPVEGEDHLDHIKKHTLFVQDNLVPEQIKPVIAQHITKHIQMLQQQITMQAVQQWMPPANPMSPNPMQSPQGGLNASQAGVGQIAPGQPQGILPKGPGIVGGPEGRTRNMS
jgi:hypothetical protein